MRVLAMIAAYNEERFIGTCIEHLARQGVEVHLIDNESTDSTVRVTEQYLGRGVVAVETFPRGETFDLASLLRRKEEIAATSEADWFMHVDADEIRKPPRGRRTLAEAFEAVEAEGGNAVNFQEFTFIPTIESPDHDHRQFVRTMRWYYPFLPTFPHRLNAWKRQHTRVDLASTAGHAVNFPGLRMHPESFILRHYQFLSLAHAIQKYADRRHHPEALARGWHGWREHFRADRVRLPSHTELRTYTSDEQLDASRPWQTHCLAVSGETEQT